MGAGTNLIGVLCLWLRLQMQEQINQSLSGYECGGGGMDNKVCYLAIQWQELGLETTMIMNIFLAPF